MRSTRWPAKAEMLAMSGADGLMRSGGVQRWEAEAANEAIGATRQAWLPILERWQADWHERARRKPIAHRTAAGLREGVILAGEITRLRRCLGIRPSPAEVREQTRLRVQRFRARCNGPTKPAAG